MSKPATIAEYHAAQVPQDSATMERLRRLIDAALPDAESKLWHAHPVWFLQGNPIVGYQAGKGGVRLMFWSGQSFATPGLEANGSFKAATRRYADEQAIDEAERIAPPERMVDIADWRHTIDRFEELEQSREAAQAGESKQAYLATLQRRLDKAAKRGDSIAVGRYNDLISSADSE